MADHPDTIPSIASLMKLVDAYYDRISLEVTTAVTTSETLADLGITTADDDAGITIVSNGTVRYNPTGAATASSGFLPTLYTVHGGKSKLDTIQFYAAAATDISIIVFAVERTP